MDATKKIGRGMPLLQGMERLLSSGCSEVQTIALEDIPRIRRAQHIQRIAIGQAEG